MTSDKVTAASGHDHAPTGWRRWMYSANHKDTGTLYLVFAICAGLVGGLFSILIRMEMAAPGMDLAMFQEGTPFFDVVVTVHGLIMVFFMVMPALIGGFGNWFVPLMIGAPDMAFPRLNNIGFWLLPPAAFLLLTSVFVGEGSGADWTIYAPQASTGSAGPAIDMVILSLLLVGISSIMGAINFITTIFNMRAPGMTLHRMPLFVWSILVAAFLLLLSLPVLAGAITPLLTDRNFGTTLFEVSGGGDPARYQHLFWFFGHPEIYILIIPGFGIVSQVISTFSKRPIAGTLGMAYGMVAIGGIGFVVWVHHMYTADLGIDARAYFLVATVVIAVPTGIKVIGWIATMWRGSIEFKTPMLFAMGMIFLITVGGVTGVVLASTGLALANTGTSTALEDTYYAVGHFHYTLFMGALFSIFAGFYYWIGKLSGRQYPELLGKIHFWIMFVGVNLTFFPMHFSGLAEMPRRVPDYADALMTWNTLSSLGSYVSFAGAMVFLFVLFRTFSAGEKCVKNPWGIGATTLEWMVASPPPVHALDNMPRSN